MFSATITICRSSFGISKPGEPSFIYQVNQLRFKVYSLWADFATVVAASQATISTPTLIKEHIYKCNNPTTGGDALEGMAFNEQIEIDCRISLHSLIR